MDGRIPVRALIFDLGDVLFKWSAETTTSIPAKTLRNILTSDVWADFDLGFINQKECYTQIADQFHLASTEVDVAFTQAFNSLQPNREVITAIQRTKRACKGLKVFAMSNMPREFHAMLAARIDRWAIFDRVFISGLVGVRKPDPAFYEHVLQSTQMQSREVMFFDDRPENVLAAKAMGIQAYAFNENSVVTELLTKLENDPFERGYRYLAENKGHFDSVTSSGVTIADNFALLLIQETTSINGLVDEAQWDQKSTWNFFVGEPVLVPGKKFPDDLDTTSLALMVVPPPEDAVVDAVLDNMLEYLCDDGRLQTYFDWSRPRFDEIVSTNVLACFYHFGRGQQLTQTLNMIEEMLQQRTYADGTRYYSRPDCCLYFIARLLRSSSDPDLHARIEPLLRSRLAERIGRDGSAIDLAMRIIACCELGINGHNGRVRADLAPLLAWQQDDGGWPASWMYQYGSTRVQLGNRGVSTAMAVRAIAALEENLRSSRPYPYSGLGQQQPRGGEVVAHSTAGTSMMVTNNFVPVTASKL